MAPHARPASLCLLLPYFVLQLDLVSADNCASEHRGAEQLPLFRSQ